MLRNVPWWTYPLAAVSSLVPAAFVGAVAAVLGSESLLLSNATCAMIFAGTTLLAALALYVRQMGRMRIGIRQAIREGFAGHRLPFCMNCGYDLRASAADRCPECGRDAAK